MKTDKVQFSNRKTEFVRPDRRMIEQPDDDGDKSGTDVDSDKTRISETEEKETPDRFDKPKREPNPDTTFRKDAFESDDNETIFGIH